MATAKELALINTIRSEGTLDNGAPSFLTGWTPVKYLGRGNYGEVYEIRRGNTSAALKIIPINEEYISEYHTEIAALERIRGERNAVHIEEYAVVNIDKGAYVQKYMIIRMELLQKLPKRMDEDCVIELGREMCGILGKCHSGKPRLIHCDIKQENILTDGKVYKLADFGVAKFSNNTHTYGFRGTLTHMSPEMHDLESYDGRSDIYSLGVTMYALLNGGNIPFSDGTNIETAVKRRFKGEPIPDIPGVSAGMMRILRKMCAPDPDSRYMTAQELARDLDALAAARRRQREAEEAARRQRETGQGAYVQPGRDIQGTAYSSNAAAERNELTTTGTRKKRWGWYAAGVVQIFIALVCLFFEMYSIKADFSKNVFWGCFFLVAFLIIPIGLILLFFVLSKNKNRGGGWLTSGIITGLTTLCYLIGFCFDRSDISDSILFFLFIVINGALTALFLWLYAQKRRKTQ